MLEAKLAKVIDVRMHPDADRLTIVTVDVGRDGTFKVVANLDDDGNPRWEVDELLAYLPENLVIPDDVLKERGYWDETKNKGYLGGSKGNRVKMQRFVGFESRGILFKLNDFSDENGDWAGLILTRGTNWLRVMYHPDENDFTSFLGLTEYVAA